MAKYKNIRIKKKGGGTRMQRVQVLASGKYKFVKNLTKSKSRPKRTRTTKRKTTRKRRNNPKRRVNRTGKKNFGLRQFISLGKKVALIAPGASVALTETGLPVQDRVSKAVGLYTGLEFHTGTFDGSRLIKGWGPYVSLRLIEKGIAILGKL